ncbi:MAG TPA: DUF4440 domain-containing protein [Candidatus Acidoferrales bacterium]|nr:DUF4440 domain-containing protein [Candidatus Acidoferrales bacterium]
MSRLRKSEILFSAISLVAGLGGCGRMREGRRIERERLYQERARQADTAIRESTVEWSKAALARDVNKAVYYYAEDAVYFVDKGALVQGKENIRKEWEAMLAEPGPGMQFEATSVDISPLADMAWERGTYEWSVVDKRGNITETKGKFLCVWKREPGNTWQVVADIDNTGQ